MDRKKYDYLFLVFFAVVIIFSCITGVRSGCSTVSRTQYDGAQRFNMEFDEPEENEFYYKFTLPDSDITGKNLAYNTSHLSSEVFIDGELVYQCVPHNPSESKSVGFRWNIVKLSGEDAGKDIVIHLTSPYRGVSPDDELLLGETADIYKSVFYEDGFRLCFAVVIFIIGVILLFYSVFLLKFSNADSIPVFFSAFSILLAIWSATGSRVCDLMFSSTLLCPMLNYYSLMLMPIAFIQFIRQIYTDRENIAWDIIQYAGAFIAILRTVLNVFSVLELRETLWITQLYIILFAVIGIVLGIREFVLHKVTHQLKLNLICLIIILAATSLEIIVLKLFHKDSIYGMFCFMVYVIVMAVNIVKQSQKLRERANEAEIYRQLAFTDELTGVFNRTAFRTDMDKLVTEDLETGKKDIKPCTIFMFDLNDLKKCNDQFGHENGDIYISSVSKIISEVFGVDGKCYRIGGDEFSVLMTDAKKNEIENRISVIQKRIQELNRKKFVVEMSVSVGYAVFDAETDEDLEATLRRADTMMYENKQKFKQSRLKTT